MNTPKKQNPINTPTHPEQYLPAGQRRCQATNKRGTQCGSPARTGYNVCWRHGAGSRKREKTGKAKPAGRPPTTGIYGTRTTRNIHDLLEQGLELREDLDNTDRELIIARAVLANALALQPDIQALQNTLEKALNSNAFMEDPHTLMEAARAVRNFTNYLTDIQKQAHRVIHMVKARAEIRGRAAQEKALEAFQEWVSVLREVLLQELPPEVLGRVRDRITREVLNPILTKERAKREEEALEA